MKNETTDYDVLQKLLELSRLEQAPTPEQEKAFSELKDEFSRSVNKSLELEDRTRRLARYLKAA